MNILLTHDDGLETEGLRIFRNALKRLGEVTIISPLTQQSAVSHSITIFQPLFIEKHNHYLGDGTPLYAVRGTPTDCVKLALGKLMKKKPDLVISGINGGANLGIDVFYSGTVAAAMEAGFWGITAMAISVEKRPRRLINWYQTSCVALKIIQSILPIKSPAGSVFNINIPIRSPGRIKGIRYTAQDVRRPADDFIGGTDPRERQYFWMKASPERTPPLKRKVSGALPSDIETVKAGYISVTPLRTNLTDNRLLQEIL